MCNPYTYPEVSAPQFEGWKANAAKKGIVLTGETEGTLKWDAVPGIYKWNAAQDSLIVDLQIPSIPRNCEIMYHDLGLLIPAKGAGQPVSSPGPALSIDDAGKYTVIGRVLRRGEALSGKRVQAWDSDAVGPDDKLGQDHTDENGFFTISFDPASFNDWGLDRHPDLYFKIFDEDGGMIGESSGNVINNAKPGIEDIVIDLRE